MDAVAFIVRNLIEILAILFGGGAVVSIFNKDMWGTQWVNGAQLAVILNIISALMAATNGGMFDYGFDIYVFLAMASAIASLVTRKRTEANESIIASGGHVRPPQAP